jgi:hypothetical protein
MMKLIAVYFKNVAATWQPLQPAVKAKIIRKNKEG